MRYRHLMLGVAMLVPVIAFSQATPNPRNPERFDVAGLPQTATSDLEREIFTLLRYHKRGDLRDATRIHLRLAEYYKEVGDKVRADDCTKMANEAWDAAERDRCRIEKMLSASDGSAGVVGGIARAEGKGVPRTE